MSAAVPCRALSVPFLSGFVALKHLAGMAERRLAAGRADDTAVILISKATLADQHIVETSLARAADDAAAANLEAPAIIAIGDVVGLRAALDPAATPKAPSLASMRFQAYAPS